MARMKKRYVIAKDRVKVSVGDIIKEMCELNELTQAELAKRSGLQESNLSDIINGKRAIGRTVAEKLAKVLNISPAFVLFAGKESREGADISNGIDVSLLEQAIQTVEENKNEGTRIQLKALRSAVEFIAKAILSVSRANLAPVGLISHAAKHSHVVYGKRKH